VQHHRPILALGLRLVGAALLATLLALVKYTAEQGIALPEIMFWRQAVSIPVLLGYLYATGNLSSLKTKRLPVHFRRAAMGMGNMAIVFLTTILLPLAVSTTLSFTTPLFAVILSIALLHEKIGPWRWLAVALGFLGIVAIMLPGAGGASDISLIGAALGLLAAFIVALVNFQIRDLGRTEANVTIVFYFAAFGTPMAAAFLPFYATAHDLTGWLLLLSIGTLGMLFQLCISASVRFAPVATVVVMDYSAIIWSTLWGWAVWDHLPSVATWLGAPLIIGAGMIIAWRERHHFRRAPPVTSAGID